MTSSVYVDNKRKYITMSFLFVNATNFYLLNANNSETKDYAMCLGNVLKKQIINNTKKIRIKKSCKIFFCWF